MLDIFKSDAFSLRTLTDAVNKIPFKPGRIGAMGIFEQFSMDTLVAMIEEKEGKLYLVPAKARGAPASQNVQQGRKMRPIAAVHLPVSDELKADEIQGIRAFGSETQRETIEGKVNEKMATMVQSLEATLEYQRVGAVKGIVLDADGVTEIIDLFETFGIVARDAVHFNFADVTDADAGVVRKLCSQIIRDTEDDLGAAPYDHIHAFVGAQFMDGLVDNAETHEAWKRWREGEALRGSFVRKTFPYANIMFEEYRGKVGSVDFFAETEARFFPVGVPGLFRQGYAPANYIETVNTMGRPIYAKTTPDPKRTKVDIDCQSNPLTYCTRPKVLRVGQTAS